MPDLFTKYEDSYNLLPVGDRNSFFLNILEDELSKYKSPVVVDIGCGAGISRKTEYLEKIRKKASKMIGIEPDESIITPPVFDEVQHCLFEDCSLAANSTDFAYSSMVMEHVSEPDKFIQKLFKILKPGGCYFFVTVNDKHYFTKFARVFKKIKADTIMLKIAKGKEIVEEYHYPLQYKFNSTKIIHDITTKHGFDDPRFVFAEHRKTIEYFPGPFKLIWHFLTWKRKIIKNKESLIALFCILKKPG